MKRYFFAIKGPTGLGCLLFTLLFWGPELLLRDLWEPDEARFAYVAREMVEDGHLLVPHRNGEYYAHKPPLMFWINRSLAKMGGVEINRITSRLPSLLGSSATLYVTSRLAFQLWGGLAGWTAPLMLATSILFWKTTGMGQMDALLLGLQFTALGLLLLPAKPRLSAQIAAYLCMGLAVLTKGPVGLLIPYGIYLSWTYVHDRTALRSRHLLWGPVVALLLPALWLGAMMLWEPPPPGFMDELLFQQNLGRVAGTFAEGHRRPFWYFVQYLPVDFLPWTFLLPAAVASLRTDTETRTRQRGLLAWMLFVVLFFSLASTKRNLYILSVYPVLAILVAGGFERLREGEFTRLFRNSVRSLGGLSLLIGLGFCVAAPVVHLLKTEVPFDLRVFIPSGLILLGTGFGLLRIQEGISSRHLIPITGGMGLALLSVAVWIYPAFNPIKVPYILGEIVREASPAPSELLLYRMHGEIQALNAGLRGRELDSPADLETALREPGPHLLVVSRRTWDELQPVLQPHNLTWGEYRMGSKTLRWVSIPANP